MLPANGGVLMVTFVSAFTSQAAADAALPAMKRFREEAQGKNEAERMALYEQIMSEMRKTMPPTTIAQVADHIEYVKKLAGVDHVGIGSDYDGNDSWPTGLEDVSKFPNLFAELIRRGWSDEDLAKLAGGNVLRALEQAEAVAKKLQATEAAPGL
jgi:membrane dipeptidase